MNTMTLVTTVKISQNTVAYKNTCKSSPFKNLVKNIAGMKNKKAHKVEATLKNRLRQMEKTRPVCDADNRTERNLI